ncbi:DUF881 domain-containing protein [Nocardioides litoris]|uniref:DUF881 domain-containing protein n=1 Tax=Nocardioides litoris TaxID=1926648 RepID=UPI00111CE000|nr:DUF881 domain-containing protein [Nocardioides litoris]
MPTDPADRVRVPLLTLITQQSLDEDYQHAAERRAAAGRSGPPVQSRRSLAVVVVVVAVFGVLASTAFAQTSRNADVASASRATLIDRIQGATDRRARQEERVTGLDQQVTALTEDVTDLVDDQQVETLDLRELQATAGFVAVRGDGVRVTVRQRADADDNQQVKDRDLRLLVNGLFAAGAEAVAVNGQRMSVTSAIRTSGEAIEVNFIGIAPPYVVEAIGDQRTLEARFAQTATGQQFASTAQFFDFTYDVQNVDDLRLPAAPAARALLRQARQAPTGPDPEEREKGGGTP